jgi:hypothetical protein
VPCRDDGEFLLRDQLYILCEPVSSSRHGDDVAILRGLTEGLSKHEDVAAEISLFHKRVRPDGLHQIVFGDHLFAVADKNQKNLKRLRR